MDFEKEIERIAKQYQDEGYAVVTHPHDDHLDGLADILAVRGNEKVAVQVKQSRADVEADKDLLRRAEDINKRPGWRFDLVVLEKENPVQRVAEKAQEPTDEQFKTMLDRARLAKEAGLLEMAITFAWAVFEAAMREVRDEVELYGSTMPAELMRTLYGNGILSRQAFDRAREAWKIRTQVVHGFVTPPIEPSLIDEMLTTASTLWGIEKLEPRPAAG